jgi:flavin-dependent dehydrogenase
MNLPPEVVIVGAGPAGLATAIAASLKGLRTVVVDARKPPIDKTCGEGLLPHGAAALTALGLRLRPDVAIPFHGIRFLDEQSSACAEFKDSPGFGLRRIRLNQLLIDRAVEVGVAFRWGIRVAGFDSRHIWIDGQPTPYDWLIGADGQSSIVRKWVHLDFRRASPKRFAFRRHFQIRPWTSVVEVYWARGCQVVVTPTGTEEVGVAVISRDPRLRLKQALPLFPALAGRLRDATPVSSELGDTTALTRLSAVTRGRVALAGDASGSVDAVTGHGLSLAFQQALHLAEALVRNDLAHYESAHRKISAMPAVMTRLMLTMDGFAWARRKVLRLFEKSPELFSKLLSVHTGAVPLSSFSVGELVNFGWRLLRAE